jgi:hypothetical protein
MPHPANKTIRALVAAVVVGSSPVLTFCDNPVATDPPLPPDAEQFSPPAIYSTWWNMTQACSELTGSLGAVTWFKTSEALGNTGHGEPVVGYWSSVSNRIVLMNSFVLDGAAVRHEMLHALLRQAGHPRNQFLGKCAGTVPCQEACVRDAGPFPQPPESPIHIGGDSLDLAVSIDPTTPDSANGGFFAITVVAHNRSAHWATVTPSVSSTDTLRTFSFDVSGPNGAVAGRDTYFDPSQRIFAPGETKRAVFDFRIGDGAFVQQLPNGNYVARGGFSDYSSADNPFVIGR